MTSTRNEGNKNAGTNGNSRAPQVPPPSLVKLCLAIIGKRLKHFFNAAHHPALLPSLSEQEKQLLLAFDLSRLELFERHQKFRQQIAAWRLQVESKRQKIFEVNMNLTYLAETVPIYALKANLDRDPQFKQLKVLTLHVHYTTQSLRLEEPQEVEPRVPARIARSGRRLREREKKWIGAGDDQVPVSAENGNGDAADTATEVVSSEDHSVDGAVLKKNGTTNELVRYRCSITNTGCGALAEMIQRSDARLLRVCLNFCQVTDAGAILLASALRSSTVLCELDLGNDASSPFMGTCMDNEIGCKGAQALALALELNTSLTLLSLSGNPIRAPGALALSKMLQVNITLKRLELERTIVGGSAHDLIDAYAQSKTLQVLNLNWCSLKPGVGAKYASVVTAKSQK